MHMLLRYSLLFYLISFSTKLIARQSNTVCKPVSLECEYLVNPLGIDAIHPRLSWQMEDTRHGARQSAYQVLVNTDSTQLCKNIGGQWNSGRINVADALINYNGNVLKPFTRYYWKVMLWDKDGKPASAAAIASFETGMMGMKNWKGSWIGDSRNVNLKPAPYFRKTFVIDKKIRSARVYIAAAGLYELYINGNKTGDHRLDPMYTRFDRRTLYVTYDVTGQLLAGANAIGVILGNGWYNHQSTAVWYFHEAPWRARPAFCFDLRITYADGSVSVIKSGHDWKTALSPVIFNSIYTGEHYDARLEQPGWNNINFNDSAWHESMERSAPSQNITAQVMHPIRDVQKLVAITMTRINDSVCVYDMGQNIAGVSELTVSGAPGTVIRLRHGERLYKNGTVDQSNIDIHYRPKDNTDPFQTDIYILKGNGFETFKPHFNYKGFQYVEISCNQPVQLSKKSLVAYFMHSDVPSVGTILTSDTIVNKLWSAVNHSYLSNLFGYPTDCPQREKNGWTGDAHIASETGLYNFEGITVYEKWMADHRDEQQPNGVLPSIVPSDGWGYEWGNGPDWTSTIAIIPWNIYLFYGDKKLLADCYDNIKRYVDHIASISTNDLTSWGLGDWVPVKSVTPVEFTSSVYYFVDANILAKTAGLLKRREDEKYYHRLADRIRNAINAKYLDSAAAIYGSGFQTELSVALYWGIVPDGLKAKVAANLAKRVMADNYHLDVGLLGTKAILNALSENGYADMAYQLAAQRTFPSWGWWIVNGATTLYENWPIDAKSDISMNHIMFGEVGAWLYKGIAGIYPDPAKPGFKNILLRPHFVAGLDSFTATHNGPFGQIFSSWKRFGRKVFYTVSIPPNSTAILRLQTSQLRLTAGRYTFEIPGDDQ